MVEVCDIVDEKSLRVWLEGQPSRFSVVIAHRAAMRVLPEYWHWVQTSKDPHEGDLTVLPVLWPSLISGVVAFYPTPENITELSVIALAASSAALAASDSALSTSKSALGAEVISSAAIASAALAHEAAATATATAASAYAAAAATAADAAYVGSTSDSWESIQSDCRLLGNETDPSLAPLWAAGENPLQGMWGDIMADLAKDEVDWAFWIKWYESTLTGTPLPWALLERIALEVKEEDWEQGPQHVNGMIAEIEAEFVADALPQADRMDVDPDTGLVEIMPILTTEEAIVTTSLKQVEFSFNVAKNSNCGLNFNSVACLYLEQTFENCRDDPNAILQNYQIALDDILEGLKNGAYLDDAKLTAFSTVLEKEIVNLLANHPEVKKADRARIAHALSLAKSDVKRKIVEELEFAKAAVGLCLDAEMSLDSKLVAEETESPAQAKAAQRLFGRIAQMYVTMKNASVAVVKKIDAATGYRFARIVMTLGKIVGWITSFFT